VYNPHKNDVAAKTGPSIKFVSSHCPWKVHACTNG